jgi:DHA2 family multidrug resistance protein-like MFS transporter
VPEGVSADAWEAARGTLGAATVTAAQLPAALGAPLLEAAREAFVRGLQITAVVGAVVMGATVVIAALMRRHLAPPAAAAP